MLSDSSLCVMNSASISSREVVKGGRRHADTFNEESKMNLRMVGAGTER